MNIKIHRGLDQIGGCITEISTETSRVFIDFGQNLPGNGEPTTPDEDKELVERIFAQNKKEHEAVFYIHEHEVSSKMASVMQTYKYVFVLASATDIERLASIKKAAKKAGKPLCVWSLFLRRTMEFFKERESKMSNGLFEFKPLCYSERLYGKLKRRGFVMVAGTSQIERIKELLGRLPQEETLLIYSSWDGYYKIPEQVNVNPQYKEFREMFHNVVDIHTSGHADRQTIKRVIECVNPKEVICIHKEADAKL